MEHYLIRKTKGLWYSLVHHTRKNSHFVFYLKGLLYYYCIPNSLLRGRLNKELDSFFKLPKDEQEYIKRRVDYYCKFSGAITLPPNAPDLEAFTLKNRKAYANEYVNSTYFFDAQEYTRYFPKGIHWVYKPGDIDVVLPSPSVTKSRPVASDDANCNNILLNLDKVRHFTWVYDPFDWEEKDCRILFRGAIDGKPNRIRFIEQWKDHPLCDLSDDCTMTLFDHLYYKYIMALEGNDVASNLKWVMSSNSIAVMPRPTCETWFMEGQLIPNYHYIEIASDYHDLIDRIQYYEEHPEEARRITEHAHEWVAQFLNRKRERLISLMVLDKYFTLSGQKAASAVGKALTASAGVANHSIDEGSRKDSKKVLFIISRFLDGGIDTMLAEYISNLSSLTSHEISLGIAIKMEGHEMFIHRLPDNINVFYFVSAKWLTWYKAYNTRKKRRFLGIVDEMLFNPVRRILTSVKLHSLAKEFDVLIDFDSTFGSLMSRRNDLKKISFFHFSFAEELKRNPRHMMRRLENMRKYDNVVTLSDAMLQEALHIAPFLKGKLVRIYNSINLYRVLVQSKAPVSDPRINTGYMLAVERLEESQKDIATLIEAYALLKARDTGGTLPALYIIGEGRSRAELEQRIASHGLERHIVLLGFIANPFPWMAKAQLVVHSSKFEGLPTVLIEALMLDKPIVSSDCPTGPSEILDGGKAGMLVPVGDVEGFADAISRLLNDKQLQGNLQRGARRHKKIFMAEKNISTLEGLF